MFDVEVRVSSSALQSPLKVSMLVAASPIPLIVSFSQQAFSEIVIGPVPLILIVPAFTGEGEAVLSPILI